MTAPAATAAASEPVVVHGRLALALQEALTAIVRLRAERQPVNDAAAFRAQMTQLLARAEQDARTAGYGTQDVRLAIFAVVAILDESALNTRQPAFADWSRRPLQDELFGGHMAGEWFFQHSEQLLARTDDAHLADVLEVHLLCLLLGFRGRYGTTNDNASLHTITVRLAERIARLRGQPGDLAPSWRPPRDGIVTRDPWLRRLVTGAMLSLLLAIVLWGVYWFTLRGFNTELQAMKAPPMAAPVPAPAAPAPARDVLYDALVANGRWATQDIRFESGKAIVQPESQRVLGDIAGTLQRHADLRIRIEGHTDNVGSPASNLKLSDLRAAAVKTALVSSFGIDGSRISTIGMGDTKPLVPNATADGKALNRRVEIVKQ